MIIQGTGVFERCDFADTGEGGVPIVLDKSPRYWFDSGKRLIIRDSSFRSSGLGRALLPCWSDVLIRGSTFVNLPIEPCTDPGFAMLKPGTLGIVNSTFEPPLSASVVTVQPPDCSVVAAGERVCDQRAHCTAVPSGGVRCSCVGEGLRYTTGVPEDGRRCEQDPRLRATLSSASLALTVRKLGPYNDSRSENVVLTATANGDEALNTSFSVIVTRIDSMSRIAYTSSDAVAIDQPSLTAFGVHLDWDTSKEPPAQQREAKLNGNAYIYSDTVQHGFRARFECAAGSVCAADGDTISFEIAYSSPSSEHINASVVQIIGMVESVPSCSRTDASIDPSETSLPHSAPITLSFTAVDCDAMPMNKMRVDFDVQWDGQPVAYDRDRGGNGSQYVSTIDSMRRKPGPHTIVVALRNALNESTGPVDRCVIFRRTVLLRCASGTVESFGTCVADTGSNSGQLITGGAIAAFMVLGLGVLGYLLYRHREHAKEVLLSFLSFEGALAFECARRFRAPLDPVGVDAPGFAASAPRSGMA
jgi:hypothetical protein